MLSIQGISADRWVPGRQAPTGVPRQSPLIVCEPQHPDRKELESFVRKGFRSKHGAAVRSFMPVLIGLRSPNGALIGVAGYRPAHSGRLYLEQYLPRPVEEIVAARNPQYAVGRSDVAEIGNFACRDCATAMRLVDLLTEFLHDQDHRWVVFTATRTVRGIMRHLGIPLVELARADKSRVVITADDWGEYYATDPRVMLGRVPSGRRQAFAPTWSA